MRWRGVGDTEVLAFFSDTYSQLRFMAGDPQTIAGGAHALCRLAARYDRTDYLPHDLPVIGTHADNEDLADGDTSFAARWNAVYAYPRVRVSTMAEYLAAVRPLTADSIARYRGARLAAEFDPATGRVTVFCIPTSATTSPRPGPRRWNRWSAISSSLLMRSAAAQAAVASRLRRRCR